MSLKYFRLILIILASLFLLSFLYLKISPFGYWSCSANFNRSNHLFLGRGCFSLPSPKERINLSKNLQIIGDPVYFSLYSPRNFDNLKIFLVFKPKLNIETPIIEAGLLVNKDLWQYQLKPVYNYYLEEKFNNWFKFDYDKYSLWHNIKDLENIDNNDLDLELLLKQYCQGLALNLCLAQYNLVSDDLLPSFRNYEDMEDEKIEQNITLRGHHSFFLYLSGSQLDLKLKAKDLNLNQDKSPIIIDVYSQNILINSYNFPDDRLEVEGSGQVSDKFDLNISLSSMPPGLYRVDLKTNDDIVFTNLKTTASKLSWRNRLWFYDVNQENIDLFTDAKFLQIKVLEPAAYQTIKFGQVEKFLDKLYLQTELRQDLSNIDLIQSISLAKGGLLIESPGVFAFKEELLFNPSYNRLDRYYNKQAKFILANYELKEKRADGYLLAEIDFDLRGVYREDNYYNFIISVPGLRVEDEKEQLVEIKEIKAKFYGKNLIDKINAR